MKNFEKISDIQKILFLSEEMLEKAQQEEWGDVTNLESRRRNLISLFFSNPVPVGNVRLADGIRTILEKDREIVKLGAARREQLRGALRKINVGKEAVQAYKIAV